MTARLLLSAIALLATWTAGAHLDRAERPVLPSAVSDSAIAELEAGRFWHATRMLRDENAAAGTPAEVLLLARAEAGWEHWSAVLELLNDAGWLEQEDGGRGLYLLGRALESEERWAEAARVYGLYVARAGARSTEGVAALARRTRSLWPAGGRTEALRTLDALEGSASVRSWTAAELALLAAAEGDVAGLRTLRTHVMTETAQDAIWRAEADAHLVAGDTASAVETFRSLFPTLEGRRRGEVAAELGLLRLAAGDTSRARPLLAEAVELARGSARDRAAAALFDLGDADLELTLQLTQLLDRAGDGARALRGYDRIVAAAEADGSEVTERVRLERARLMATVAARQAAALEEFRAIRESTTDERVGARNLEVWRRMRQRQGLDAQVATLRRWLLEEYPGSDEAIALTWRDATNAEVRGQLEAALDRYAFIAEHAPTSARAGMSRMRSGQIHLRRADLEAAAEVFETYLADFPNGRRWQEAAYWAGRIRLELGDSVVAQGLLRRAMREQPVEYYAVVAAELLGVPYELDLPEGEAPFEPTWLTDGLRRLDLLTEAGLERGAAAEIARLRERAEPDRPARLRLAEALIERGRTIDGINIGWAILDDSGGWDRQLLRVTFPFPYRELVRREAAEWGIDPLMMAAIIRQESAFKADIVSRAGAIGLMQVMPPTGAQLARSHGPDPFRAEVLSRPEVNLHLGAAFFVDMSARYDNDLPLVLSAYNAGPTRATRWRRYPEASDPLRFTERIPIDETRGYVKSVRRNLGLYQVLYGDD